jgi:hypothetical protein
LEYRTQGGRCALRLLYSPWPMEWDCPPSQPEAILKPQEERPGRGKETDG